MRRPAASHVPPTDHVSAMKKVGSRILGAASVSAASPASPASSSSTLLPEPSFCGQYGSSSASSIRSSAATRFDGAAATGW